MAKLLLIAVSALLENLADSLSTKVCGSRTLGEWFKRQACQSLKGLQGLGLRGGMELRFALHDSIGKSQLELLDGARRAQIRTFGWPIGVILDGRDEYRPRPVSDGIRAEVAIKERALSGEPSYDFGALNTNADFYLLQSLFEDSRKVNKLVFNTRIVRVAQSLMFCSRLYQGLGVADGTRLSIRATRIGLAGRELTSSSPDRHVFPASTTEYISQTAFVERVGALMPMLVQHVQRITAPLFMLFDFKEFQPENYENIVSRFTRREVS